MNSHVHFFYAYHPRFGTVIRTEVYTLAERKLVNHAPAEANDDTAHTNGPKDDADWEKRLEPYNNISVIATLVAG